MTIYHAIRRRTVTQEARLEVEAPSATQAERKAHGLKWEDAMWNDVANLMQKHIKVEELAEGDERLPGDPSPL